MILRFINNMKHDTNTCISVIIRSFRKATKKQHHIQPDLTPLSAHTVSTHGHIWTPLQSILLSPLCLLS